MLGWGGLFESALFYLLYSFHMKAVIIAIALFVALLIINQLVSTL